MINTISTTNQHRLYQNQTQKLSPNTKTATSPEQEQAPSFTGDTVSLNQQPAETNTYGVSNTSTGVTSPPVDLRQLIVNTFTEQGLTTQIAVGDTTIDLKDLTPEKAQELIAEDGFLGVEQTSDRIVEMAISLGGNDPARLEDIMAGIEKGFEMATSALGGSLPDISNETHDMVMEKLSAWAQV